MGAPAIIISFSSDKIPRGFLTLPYSEDYEGAILHPKCQLRSVRTEGHAPYGLFHIAASNQGMVSKAPQPAPKGGESRRGLFLTAQDLGVIKRNPRDLTQLGKSLAHTPCVNIV